ncbi:MAG: agmatinase [Candidatus Kapabacteria bacterium]|nr:agmatinase [Candidatus Kapabacteria bacterium]
MKTLNSENNFLAIDIEHSSIENSKIVIVSAPYEHTVSYGGGTKNGPEAIIKASAYVEFYDDEFDRELCFEKGIATLEPINFDLAKDGMALFMIENQVTKLLDLDKFVVTLGGEHTISTAPIRAHALIYPNMSVLQFDAHSDLRHEYQESVYSHACIMARVVEFLPTQKITQVGIRAQCKEEAEFIKTNGINTFYASGIKRGLYGQNWGKSVVDSLADDIYITFDVDFFDPSIMPSTGTPEPDGFLYNDALEIFREIKRQGKRIIGFDVVELAPRENLQHPDLTTARLIYKIMNFAF